MTKEMLELQKHYAQIKPCKFDIAMQHLKGYRLKSDDEVIFEVRKDTQKAAELFRQDLDTGRGLYGLGVMSLSGEGCEKDEQKAYEYFNVAFPLILKNRDSTDGSFERLLAKYFLFGDMGQPRTLYLAEKHLKSAAEKGDAEALYILAYNYYWGEKAVPEWETNKDLALCYAKKATLHPFNKYPEAGYIAGDLLDDLGREDEAREYYQIAARQGQDDAQIIMGIYYDEIDVPELAIQYFRRASEQGNTTGQFQLGRYYYYGLGIKKDQKEGLKHILNAATRGDTDAKEWLKNNT